MWDCEKYKCICEACPRLGSNNKNDLSKKVFTRKKKAYAIKNNLTIVGVSNWITECSKSSTLLKDKNHKNIPNPVETNIYKPFDQIKARELWNLPKNKKLVLFGSVQATSDINKGFKELCDAIGELSYTDLEFVVFGSNRPQSGIDLKYKTHYLGTLTDDVSLVTLYSAVDVMVVPSLQESFGLTAAESMACGTPVVAFGATGLLDIVDHKKNGFLAKPYISEDLACGIKWVLNTSKYDEISLNAREKVLKKFDVKVVVKQYLALYNSILDLNQ